MKFVGENRLLYYSSNFQLGTILPPSPGNTWQRLETFLVFTIGSGMLLASSGQGPEMLKNML